MEILEVLDATASVVVNLSSNKKREPFSKDGLIFICSILISLFCIICTVENFEALKLIENYREYLFYTLIGSIILSISTIYILYKINIVMNIKMESFFVLWIALTFIFVSLFIYFK